MPIIEKAMCSCGGVVNEVEQTLEEKKDYNCMWGCCGIALECKKCGTKFLIEFESPDQDYTD